MKERDGGWIYLGNQVDREHAIEIPAISQEWNIERLDNEI